MRSIETSTRNNHQFCQQTISQLKTSPNKKTVSDQIIETSTSLIPTLPPAQYLVSHRHTEQAQWSLRYTKYWKGKRGTTSRETYAIPTRVAEETRKTKLTSKTRQNTNCTAERMLTCQTEICRNSQLKTAQRMTDTEWLKLLSTSFWQGGMVSRTGHLESATTPSQ